MLQLRVELDGSQTVIVPMRVRIRVPADVRLVEDGGLYLEGRGGRCLFTEEVVIEEIGLLLAEETVLDDRYPWHVDEVSA